MCGLRTRPQTDTDPPPFFDRTAIGGGHIVSPPRGDTLLPLRREFAESSAYGGSVAEWLACWTQAQKGQGVNRSREAVG